jgi:hypothetical protein
LRGKRRLDRCILAEAAFHGNDFRNILLRNSLRAVRALCINAFLGAGPKYLLSKPP